MTKRLTYTTAAVLQALSLGHRYGFDIAEAVGLRPGSVYQVLRRLEDSGLVRGEWEDVEVSRGEGRPARKYYRLTRDADPLIERTRERFRAVDHLPGLKGRANP